MPPLLTAAEDTLLGLQEYVKEVYKIWWSQWESAVLSNLFENPKWTQPEANLKVGDICLLHLSVSKHSPQGHKYCKVIKLCLSTDSLIRKVSVNY